MSRRTTAVALAALISATAPATGCAFAVEHPAVAAGTVTGALGFGTCRLASDNNLACLAVAGTAGVALALITAVALWLGGDGHSVPDEPQAQPLPDDPINRHPRESVEPAPPASSKEPAPPAPAEPAVPAAAPGSPAPVPSPRIQPEPAPPAPEVTQPR